MTARTYILKDWHKEFFFPVFRLFEKTILARGGSPLKLGASFISHCSFLRGFPADAFIQAFCAYLRAQFL